MALTFPSSPSNGQIFTANNKSWVWNGSSWNGAATSNVNAATLDTLDSTQFLRSDAGDTFTGNLTTGANNYITFGPNSSWNSYLRIGGNGRTVSGTVSASVVTTNGNLHLDSGSDKGTYLNYYAGTAGTLFGSGASSIVAVMGPDGDLWKGSSDNTGSKYWHAGNDGSGSGLDADLLDGVQGTGYLSNGLVANKAQILMINRVNSTSTGISWYDDVYNSWVMYMAQAGQTSVGPRGNLTAPTGSIVTSWAQRSHIENAGGYGWTFESQSNGSTSPIVRFEIRSSDGSAYSQGNITAAGNITANSDISLKDNIEVIPGALGKVLQIRGVTYNRNDIEGNPRQTGVIAQEVEKVLPEVISEDNNGIKSVAYGNMISLLIEAIKEQQTRIDMLEEKLNADNT